MIKKFEIPSLLVKNSARHCATIMIAEGINGHHIGQPDVDSGNGTLTFVRYKERVLG